MHQALGGFQALSVLLTLFWKIDTHSGACAGASSRRQTHTSGTLPSPNSHRSQVWIVREGMRLKGQVGGDCKALSCHSRKRVHGASLKNASRRVSSDSHFV